MADEPTKSAEVKEPEQEQTPQKGDLTVALRKERAEVKRLREELAAARAKSPEPKKEPAQSQVAKPKYQTDEELGFDPAKQDRFAESIVQDAVAKATQQAETKLTLKYEMDKYEVFQSKDRYVQAAAQAALQDKLEQGLDLSDAVAEAAREIEGRFVVPDKSKKRTPAGSEPKEPPPTVAPGSSVAATVIGEVGKYESPKDALPDARAAAAKSYIGKFMDKMLG